MAVDVEKINFTVDSAHCVRCGRCVDDCVVRAIEMKEVGPVLARPEDCLQCQHCLAVCPTASVSVLGRRPGDAPPNTDLPTAESMRRLIHGRRSVRWWAPEDVPADVLRDCLTTAGHAPTGVNTQALHFGVLATRAAMDAWRGKVYDRLEAELSREGREAADGDDTLREFVADWRSEQRDFIFRGAPHMVVVSVSPRAVCGPVDPMIALAYLDLYAPTRGVGTVWCGFAMHALNACRDRSLWREAGVPRGYRPAYTMLLGRPAFGYPRGVERGPIPMALQGVDGADGGA